MNDELRDAIHGWDHDPDAVQAWADCMGETVTEWDAPTRERFDDAFCGEWVSFEEYVSETCCDNGLGNFGSGYMPPEMVSEFYNYIDWEQVAHDWQCSGEFSVMPASRNPYDSRIVRTSYVFRMV